MSSLNKPKLGTPKSAWQYYSLHLTGSYIIKEFFLASYYKQCIDITKKQCKGGMELNNAFETVLNQTLPQANQINDLYNWTIEMSQQNYHEMYTHGFIGMWSAFETGIENHVAAIIDNDKQAAQNVMNLFKKKPYAIEDWPWGIDICLNYANKLETKAKISTENGGVDLFERLKKLFSWLDLDIMLDQEHIYNLSEANRMRNIILHRYGEISSKDAQDFPKLKQWKGDNMPIDSDKHCRYQEAMSQMLLAIINAMTKSRYT